MKIPLLDVSRQYEAIRDKADEAILKALRDGHYIMGPNVLAFEEEFARDTGVRHAISVGNGTDALVIALKAMGIGEGDEIITSPFTFFATAEAISAVGATPVFVDVRRDTFNLDETLIESAITSKTKAIMPVHIFGLCAEMDAINRIAKKHNLLVLEDACQAAGSRYHGKKAGALGDAACFSFFPTKNLSCAGDGGIITTDNDDLALICRALRAHASGENGHRAYNLLNRIHETVEVDQAKDNTVYNPRKYYNYLIGHNSRLDEIQAILLRIRLPLLEESVQKRRSNAAFYSAALQNSTFVPPQETGDVFHSYHQYVVQSEERTKAVDYLGQRGIATGVYYPVPLHLQKAYTELGYQKGDLPAAEHLAERTFALPIFPELTASELEYITNALKEFGRNG